MKARELKRLLKQHGFKAVSAKKHIKYKHSDGRWTVISKGNDEIEGKTLKEIEDQIDVKLT